jgi:hypothetical protein
MMGLRRFLVTSFRSDVSLSSDNSFLNETDHNSSIDDDFRREIEAKYKRSPANAHYKFPRKQVKEILSLSVKTEARPSSRLFRERMKLPMGHLRNTSEKVTHSPHMTRTPDLGLVRDRNVLRKAIKGGLKIKSKTPSPRRALKLQRVRRLPALGIS